MPMRTRTLFFLTKVDMKQLVNVLRSTALLWASLLILQILICVSLSPAQQDQSPPSSSSQPKTDEQTPSASQPDATTQPAQQPEQPKSEGPQSQPSTPEQKKATAKPVVRKHSIKKRATVKKSSPANQSGKVVVRNGGTKDNSGQLTPAMTQEQEFHSRENTAQLLATTDSNLKAITGRQLSDAQQGMLDQIRTYMRQSKDASDAGDLPRAHTLAYKAHLLSDELARK